MSRRVWKLLTTTLLFSLASVLAVACAPSWRAQRVEPLGASPELAGRFTTALPDGGSLAFAPSGAVDGGPSATPGEAGGEETEVAAGEGEGEEGEDLDDAEGADDGESHDVVEEGPPGLRYTMDLSDAQLSELWRNSPEKLGSISIGFTDEGRLVNAEQFPEGEDWKVVSPELTWATSETIGFVMAAIKKVREQYPNAPLLRVNQMSSKEGGYLRPHKSHQNGRDVDLGFYYPNGETVRKRERERYIQVPLNWALLKALVTLTDVQVILLDKRVQKVIYDHAVKAGENREWLDSLFKGKSALIKHAKRHRDHFHVRFFNRRAQELGFRVAPMLAERPEQNLAMHRVRRGDTLGAIARRYGSSVPMLKKANRMAGTALRLAQVLKVPLRGPCTRCPVPPPVVVPDRRLPPGFEPTTTTSAAPASSR